MKHGIDKLDNDIVWRKLYDELASSDKSPFFTPHYYRAYMEVEKHPAQCFWIYQDEENYLFYPHLIRSINDLGYELDGDYYDVCGAYGYNGPLGKVKDPWFLASFNKELLMHFKENNVVTEFVRYCPIIQNRKYHSYTEQIHVLDNVYIDLSHGLDYVWENFGRRVRTAVRKGESYDLRTVFLLGEQIDDDQVNHFFEIYNSTMQRNDAEDYYYFDFSFFKQLIAVMKEKVLLSFTYLEDKAISTELLLIDEELCFGFLGGTLAEYYQYKANTYQRWQLLQYISELGIQKYSMGGGAQRNDGIYSFKKSFAKNCDNPFYIGTKVHNLEVYDQVVDQWQRKHPLAAARFGHMLQGYRKLDA